MIMKKNRFLNLEKLPDLGSGNLVLPGSGNHTLPGSGNLTLPGSGNLTLPDSGNLTLVTLPYLALVTLHTSPFFFGEVRVETRGGRVRSAVAAHTRKGSVQLKP